MNKSNLDLGGPTGKLILFAILIVWVSLSVFVGIYARIVGQSGFLHFFMSLVFSPFVVYRNLLQIPSRAEKAESDGRCPVCNSARDATYGLKCGHEPVLINDRK